MLVKEIMNRAGIPAFGIARIFIEDGLTEMNILSSPFVKENSMSFFKHRRFYRFPEEAIGIKDIMIKNHLNSNGEYRSIPRLLNEPKVKDTVGGTRSDEDSGDEGSNSGARVSDLDGTLDGIKQGTAIDDLDNKAREYAYFLVGDKLALVEKDIYQDSTGDVINDTDAYQRSSYRWVSPQQNGTGAIKIRYSYNPLYSYPLATGTHTSATGANQYFIQSMIATADASALAAGATHEAHIYSLAALGASTTAIDLGSHTATTDGYIVTGRDLYFSNAGYFTGLWNIKYLDFTGAVDHVLYITPSQGRNQVFLDMKNASGDIGGLALSGAHPLVHLRTRSLYSDHEDFDVPISIYQSLSLVDYCKSRLAGEAQDIKLKVYYENEFRKKLEKQDSARISGPRMISPGPFAIK